MPQNDVGNYLGRYVLDEDLMRLSSVLEDQTPSTRSLPARSSGTLIAEPPLLSLWQLARMLDRPFLTGKRTVNALGVRSMASFLGTVASGFGRPWRSS